MHIVSSYHNNKLIKNHRKQRMSMATASSFPLAITVATITIVSAYGLRAAEATIESTCAAAAARDGRVDAAFCARRFGAYHGAAEAGAWGLARTAALIGVSLADDVAYDIGEGGIIRAPPSGGARARAALRECAQAYDAVGTAFAEASDELGARRYAAAEERFARVAPLARRCDGALAVAGARTPSAMARYSADCQQMAVIGIAITNLIK